MDTVFLKVTKTTLGLWYSARSEHGAQVLREAGFPPEFGSAEYTRVTSALKERGYGFEVRNEDGEEVPMRQCDDCNAWYPDVPDERGIRSAMCKRCLESYYAWRAGGSRINGR